MKILLVNNSDIHGGAARAAYRLHRALLDSGVNSQMLVQSKSSDDYTVIDPGNQTKIQKGMNLLRPILDALPVKFYKNKTQTLFSSSWLPFGGVVDYIKAIDPDVVHLHWICGGMIRIEDLKRINKPIVWSLHDNWAFTGGCHIMGECEKFKDNCGMCPRLGSHGYSDLSRWIYNRKLRTFCQIQNFTIVGVSRWISQCAKESSLLKDQKIVNLPNPIDIHRYFPIDKQIARNILKLPIERKLITFGSIFATSDINKGYKKLIEALNILPQKDNIELVFFGIMRPQDKPNLDYVVHYFGHLHDDVSLQLLYSASDVIVMPSLQEAFGQTASESMACGIPVVAFGTSGLLDIVDHKKNGYLAKPYISADLANGIHWVLNNPDYESLSQNAREKVLRCFDSKLVANLYIELYRSIIT